MYRRMGAAVVVCGLVSWVSVSRDSRGTVSWSLLPRAEASGCKGWRKTVPKRGRSYCAPCGSCGIARSGPGPICSKLVRSCGGSFGTYLHALTKGCRSKKFTDLFGLDGLTYGIRHAWACNMPSLMKEFVRQDAALVRSLFRNAGVDQWLRGGKVRKQWFKDAQIKHRGLFCHQGFRQALEAATREPTLIKAQAMNAWKKLRKSAKKAARYFRSTYGVVAYAVIANNRGRCKLGEMARSCQGRGGETARVDCFIDLFVKKGCRGSVKASGRRAKYIRSAFSGASAKSRPFQLESLDTVFSRCGLGQGLARSGGSSRSASQPPRTSGRRPGSWGSRSRSSAKSRKRGHRHSRKASRRSSWGYGGKRSAKSHQRRRGHQARRHHSSWGYGGKRSAKRGRGHQAGRHHSSWGYGGKRSAKHGRGHQAGRRGHGTRHGGPGARRGAGPAGRTATKGNASAPGWMNTSLLGKFPTAKQNGGKHRSLRKVCGAIIHEGFSKLRSYTSRKGRWAKNGISSHFAIEQNGTIYYLKDVGVRGIHAGGANGGTVGIDLGLKKRHGRRVYSDAMVKSLGRLLRWLADVTALKYDVDHVLGHTEASAAKKKSGVWKSKRKHDPQGFPWARLGLSGTKSRAILSGKKLTKGQQQRIFEANRRRLLRWRKGRCD